MKRHVIYVPGIADDIYRIQSNAVRFWRLYGVHGHFHVMPWLGREGYSVKFQRLLDEIDRYAVNGQQVSLVGTSAGASAILNAYAVRKKSIAAVVLICPWINNPDAVNPKIYAENPAFKVSLRELQANLEKFTGTDKQKILTYYSPADNLISAGDRTIPGVREKRLPPLKHTYANVYAITFGARRLLSQLKRLG